MLAGVGSHSRDTKTSRAHAEHSPAVYNNCITLEKPHTGNLTVSEPHMGD